MFTFTKEIFIGKLHVLCNVCHGSFFQNHSTNSVFLLFVICFRAVVYKSKIGSLILSSAESVVRRCCSKQIFLNIIQYSQENSLLILLVIELLKLIKKETLTQVFPREYYEIFKNSVFTEHLRWLLLVDVISMLITLRGYLEYC